VAYLKFGYLERPSVGVAVALTLNGGGKSVGDIKIAVGCAGPAPKRVEEAEALLKAKSTDEATQNLPKAGSVAGAAAQAISDLHGSQEYKEHIVGVLLKRAFQSALSQC
jgi:CO/xanthine dehydrogenase FAD-binding subunit